MSTLSNQRFYQNLTDHHYLFPSMGFQSRINLSLSIRYQSMSKSQGNKKTSLKAESRPRAWTALFGRRSLLRMGLYIVPPVVFATNQWR